MDIQTAKLELLKVILENEDEDFIHRLADIVKKENPDFWEELSASEKEEIHRGLGELDRGVRISLDSVLKKMPGSVVPHSLV